MKKIFLSVTLLYAFVLVCLAADLSGTWRGIVKTPEGDLEVTCKLKAEGEKLTGNVESSYGEFPIINGKITGSDFTFEVQFENDIIQSKGKFYGDSVVIRSGIQGTPTQTTYRRIQ